MDGDSIKDIFLLLIITLNEFFGEFFFINKLSKEICICLRVIIGFFVHIIELSYIISRQSYKTEFFHAIISFLVITCVSLVVNCIYLAILIIKRKYENLFQCIHSNLSIVLFVFSKVINLSVASIIVLKSFDASDFLSNKDSFENRIFQIYGLIDLLLTILSILRSLIIHLTCKFYDKNNSINSFQQLSHIETYDNNLKIEIEMDYKETNENICLTLPCVSCFCCIHLLCCALGAKYFSKKSIKNIQTNQILSKKYLRKSKFMNKLFLLFCILTTLGISIGLSFFFALNPNIKLGYISETKTYYTKY